MHKPGHLGASLLAYAPLMAVLIALDHSLTAFVGLAVAGALAMFPDIDQRIPQLKHRGISHTIWTPLGVAVAVTALSYSAAGLAIVLAIGIYTGIDRLVPGLRRRGVIATYGASLLGGFFAWSMLNSATGSLPHFELVIGATAGISVSAHLLADSITPAGIAPFRPFSEEVYTLGLVTADSWLANGALLLAGIGSVGTALVYANQLPL